MQRRVYEESSYERIKCLRNPDHEGGLGCGGGYCRSGTDRAIERTVWQRTTVVTFLGKMADKGFVSTHRRGKNAYVHAEKTEDAYKSKLMSEETDFWFEGKVDALLSAVCDKRKVSKEEIERMRDLLDVLDK